MSPRGPGGMERERERESAAGAGGEQRGPLLLRGGHRTQPGLASFSTRLAPENPPKGRRGQESAAFPQRAALRAFPALPGNREHPCSPFPGDPPRLSGAQSDAFIAPLPEPDGKGCGKGGRC